VYTKIVFFVDYLLRCVGGEKMNGILKDYTEVVIETDDENPVTIASITNEDVKIADGYRVRLIPKYD
jgi:hypothetical protein